MAAALEGPEPASWGGNSMKVRSIGQPADSAGSKKRRDGEIAHVCGGNAALQRRALVVYMICGLQAKVVYVQYSSNIVRGSVIGAGGWRLEMGPWPIRGRPGHAKLQGGDEKQGYLPP